VKEVRKVKTSEEESRPAHTEGKEGRPDHQGTVDRVQELCCTPLKGPCVITERIHFSDGSLGGRGPKKREREPKIGRARGAPHREGRRRCNCV